MSLQSKRHGFIASLLGIPHVVVCVNKMDLVDYSEERFEEIREQYSQFARKLEVSDMKFIPVSALLGDNVAEASSNMDWYKGESLLYHMESVYTASDKNMIDLRLPIQLVLRPNQDFRGFCTTVASGVVRTGDTVVVLPSGKESRVKRITTYDGDLDYAFSPQSVTITLEDEIDVDRGDMLVHPANMPLLQSDLEAMVIWMGEEPMRVGSTYLIKHTTKTVRAVFARLDYKIDPSELHREKSDRLLLNEIGRATLELFTPIAYDPYSRNRATGGFIIIDEKTNRTVGAGIAIERAKKSERIEIGSSAKPKSRNLTSHKSLVGKDERGKEYKQKGATIWLTGLTFAGKSTIAYGLEKMFHDNGHRCVVLDGENLRHGLNRDLGFSPADRRENIRRMAEVAGLLNDSGLIVIVASISPYRSDRHGACEIVGDERFVEVFVDAPLDVCKQRDDRGLYKSALKSLIPDFTGITAPYEFPENPDIHLRTDSESAQASVETVLRYIEKKKIVW